MLGMTGGGPLYVIAGNYQQFVHWCRDHDIDPRDERAVRHVSTGRGLLGARQGSRYMLVGTCRERRDWREINETLRVRGAVPDDCH